MCGICNRIGIRHEDLNLQEYSPALPIYKDAASSSGTLNFNEGDNIIIPSENGVTYRGLSGDDAYIITNGSDLFITVGKKNDFEFLEQNNIVIDDEEEEEIDDELDFSMF